MLFVDVPTRPEFRALTEVRGDACVSIYLTTTPISQNTDESRIALGNFAKQAHDQLEAAGFDKRRLAEIMEHIDDLNDDDEFWRLQANSLAVLVTPERMHTFRLANSIVPTVQVSDRFHLTPLLRAITFSHGAFVLALSENAVRLVEVFPDLPPVTVKVAGLPKDAANAVGVSSINKRSFSRRIHGSEGQNVRLRQYVRQVDAALRAVLSGRETPLILAATGRLASIYRSVCTYPNLLPDLIENSPDRISDAEISKAARPILDAAYREEILQLQGLYESRFAQGRATSDISDAGRAATFGVVEALMVDIDSVTSELVDEETGAVSFVEQSDATNYGIVDEIAGRALITGAKVLGVRKSDMPGAGEVAAILRYAV